MKRILLMILTLTLCLPVLAGCANTRYKGPLSCTRYDVEKDGVETVTEIDFTEDAANDIISILNSAVWDDEALNIDGYNYEFRLKNATVMYNPKIGMLDDRTNGRYCALDLSSMARLNKLIGVTDSRIIRIYDSPIYSFVMGTSEVPEIEIGDNVIYTVTDEEKERLGTVTKKKLTYFNFDSYIKKYEGFDHSKLASELRKDNETAYEVTPDGETDGIGIYYIMEQKNCETIIVYGHYDGGEKENEIRFIFAVTE